jgi:DNA-binding MarR family transcriptional regulator
LRLAQALYPQALTQEDRDTPETSEDCGDTMGRLSERLGVRHNALTQAADRLINHGLAERTGDPRDRRIVRLRLTTKGRSWVEARRERRRAHLTGLWRQLNAAERTEFLLAVHVLDAAGRRSTSEQQDPAPVEAPASQQLEALFAQVSCRKEDY